MPELPEVEIVRQSLHKKIKRKKVKRVIIKNRNLRFKIPLNFSSFLKNQKIIKVDRYSKYLIFHLSNKSFFLLHLGMSGTIHVVLNNKWCQYCEENIVCDNDDCEICYNNSFASLGE